MPATRREHAPRRGRFTAQRSGRPETTGSIGPDERTETRAPKNAQPLSFPMPNRSTPRVVVVGAGAFGGWTALTLAERGVTVTLIDAWGPGNARASSGGETRVIRSTYGTRAVYTEMAMRALARWQAYDARWQRGFLRKTGALWMVAKDDGFARASIERSARPAYPFTI